MHATVRRNVRGLGIGLGLCLSGYRSHPVIFSLHPFLFLVLSVLLYIFLPFLFSYRWIVQFYLT
jgi:hypothetical protein